MNLKNKKAGLIKMIIIIIIAIAIVSWYGFDLKTFFTSPQAMKNYSYVWNIITDVWTNYLATPAGKLWDIWVQYIWSPFMDMLKIGNHTEVLIK
jgi:hypothetical protein